MIEFLTILGFLGFVVGIFLFFFGLAQDDEEFLFACLVVFMTSLTSLIVGADLEYKQNNPQNQFTKEQKALLASLGMGKYIVDQTNRTVQFILTPKDRD